MQIIDLPKTQNSYDNHIKNFCNNNIVQKESCLYYDEFIKILKENNFSPILPVAYDDTNNECS